MPKIIDGNKIREKILSELKSKISKLKQKPGLAIVLVGDNPASQIYVNSKESKCKEMGAYCERYGLPKDVSEMDLLKLIDELNNNPKIHGILVQLPLPKHLDEKLVTNSILPGKDVDGFTPSSLGSLMSGSAIIAPATPRAIIYLIESVTKIEGKHAVVVGRSNIVGKPVAMMLLERNATVTICHSKTKGLENYTKQADILVVACGSPKMIKVDMVKKGAVVIDVGINRTAGNKIVGDVDFDSVKEVASCITPVPGGVGPMTIAMLMDNLLKAVELKK
ncbi:bifunctional 5,10-methylenetetrahydrofolate dehydrogenase/5,10-methenyltetrahydrofolate cyclohydrolase [Candidatus Woesearchaeota archaeon]|nr:bifunctional 5,10-methylenetetrahydrofolate dehydrogenase/5,10-methenyltetrahydrofolate cyclohydrolase [Candidatus Woesearchaeota archaeon]